MSDQAQQLTQAAPAAVQQTAPPAVPITAAAPPVIAADGGYTVPSGVEQTPAPDAARTEINAFVSSLGYDPSRFSTFTDVSQVRQALSMQIENSVHHGLGVMRSGGAATQPGPTPFAPYQPVPAPQQAAPVVPASKPIDLKGLDDNDPATPIIKSLVEELQTVRGAAEQSQQQARQMQESVRQEAIRRLHSEAEQIVDSWKSPLYGVGQNRNAFNQGNKEMLYQFADAIEASAKTNGQRVPSLKHRLEAAKEYHAMQFGVPAGQSTQTPAAQQPGLQQMSPNNTGPAPAMKLTDKWSEMPGLMQVLATR